MPGARPPGEPPMRVAVVDIGTNSTRLLVADVDGDGALTELDRRTVVTRLGQGVDATGALADEAGARPGAGAPHSRPANRAPRAQRTIPGDEEARLTFLGATSERPPGAPSPVVVIDIGGGSTEFVVGERRELIF